MRQLPMVWSCRLDRLTSEDFPQMTRQEAATGDRALCYALQTHLCYSHLTPDSIYFRVLKERLDETGYIIVNDDKIKKAIGRAIDRWYKAGLLRFNTRDDGSDDLLLRDEIYKNIRGTNA